MSPPRELLTSGSRKGTRATSHASTSETCRLACLSAMATAPTAREVLAVGLGQVAARPDRTLERRGDRPGSRPRQVRVRHDRPRARPRPRRARRVRSGGAARAGHRPRRRPVRPSHGGAALARRRGGVCRRARLVREHRADRGRADLRFERGVRSVPSIRRAVLARPLRRRRRPGRPCRDSSP